MDQETKPKFKISILLFVATLATTIIAGAFQQGVNPIETPFQIVKGLPFALTLIFILLSHELGHYIMSKKHNINVTLPYFIPAPSFIGTFGAFIKMKSPLLDRKTLLDVGASGPLVGTIVSIPFLIIGLKLSEVRIAIEPGGAALGSSLLFSLLAKLTLGSLPETHDIILHPIGFAGWIGLLVTSLNLLPVGQLDGGHVAYAVLGEKHKRLSIITVFFLFALGFFGWKGWFIWGGLLLLMGIRHPRPLDQWTPLDRRRKIIGWITLITFVLTFTPMPFRYI
ncbi:MAG: site-2 protease family protein [Deltaproteobacteria bacterium]|jgi:membrane-associated protease RseP (regulator of RpoE activity)|nr:MAG: site-2 protease family protein [Deltaproteobacteria bacterium]